MQFLVYGFTSILTSTATATAVLHYAAALSQSSLSDVVSVPAIDLFGMPITVGIVLGPGIAVLAQDAPDDELETEHDDFVDEVTARTRAVQSGQRHSV